MLCMELFQIYNVCKRLVVFSTWIGSIFVTVGIVYTCRSRSTHKNYNVLHNIKDNLRFLRAQLQWGHRKLVSFNCYRALDSYDFCSYFYIDTDKFVSRMHSKHTMALTDTLLLNEIYYAQWAGHNVESTNDITIDWIRNMQQNLHKLFFSSCNILLKEKLLIILSLDGQMLKVKPLDPDWRNARKNQMWIMCITKLHVRG